MASSFSSHQQNEKRHAFSGIEPSGKRRKVSESTRSFDVFINHRGTDVKKTLATQLYNSLRELDIRAFLDSEEKQLGDSFPSTIETAIGSASVHIAIFSKGYAESPWCLAELVLMLESQAKIIPLFYGVKPWELRYIENGVYADTFTKYKEKGRYIDNLENWKEALQSASLLTGFEFNNSEPASLITGLEFNNSEEFKNVVLAVQKEVKRKKPLFVARYPVGLKKIVEDFERQCVDELVQDFERHRELNEGKHQSKIIGIYGMGGAGKTTLAKELFNRKRSEYTRDSFLFDVREVAARNELPSLQRKLLKDLFGEDPPNFHSIEEGTSNLRDRLGKSKISSFLIVLDDIDDLKQLDALLFLDIPNIYANGLVIVTTRDVGVLISAGIPIRCSLQGMNRDDGRELFCWHSFRQSHPASGYENLVDDFLQVCGGLPLSLQVLGWHVYGRPAYYWRLELGKIRKSLPGEIRDRLKISVDALDWEERQIFIDIACFFVNKPKSVAIRSWEGSGWSGHLALETLKDRCLVEEIEIWRLDGLEPMWVWDQGTDLGLRMHDHLRDLGREMANELNHPSRLWHPRDLKSLEFMGFQNILSQTKGRSFYSIFDETMNSRITYFVGASDDSPETSTALLWLQLDYVNRLLPPLNASIHPSIPSWIPLQNLQCLRINNGYFKRLWQSHVQAPSQLKELQISETSLEEFPDFSRMGDNLEMVVIDAEEMPTAGWSFLPSLNPSNLYFGSSTLRGELASNYRGNTTTYSTNLVVWNFKVSGELALNNGTESSTAKVNSMGNLETLQISKQELLTKISISGNHFSNLESLSLHDIENLLEVDLTRVNTLHSLEVNNCKNLKQLSGTSDLSNLLVFHISQCPELEELILGHLGSLERITVVDCKHLKSVSGTSDVRNIVELNINECSEHVESYYSKSVSGISDLRKLVELTISECPELQELSFAHISCLEKITIGNCNQLKTVSGISDLYKLVDLNISRCEELLELCLVGLNYLERITVDRCGNLKCLDLDGCKDLKGLSGMKGLEKLVTLYIHDCSELEELPDIKGLSCLEWITIDGCGKLNYLRLYSCKILKKVSGNFDLAELYISDCPKLEELPCFVCLTCLNAISIVRCGKLQKINLPTTVNRLELKDCGELHGVLGISDLRKLVNLKICECPEFKELNVTHLRCLEEITIENCENLKYVSGISVLSKIVDLNIFQCRQLELDLRLVGMKSLERITVDRCGKLKCLELNGCKNLETVSGMEGLEELAILNICDCPELEYLPSLEGLSCLNMIAIDGCWKLNYMTLRRCENLKRVAGNLDLKWLKIEDCSEIRELPCLTCLQEISIVNCGKLQNITLPTTLYSLS